MWGGCEAGVTHREHVLVSLSMWLLLRVVLLALPLGPHCLRCPWGVLAPRLRAVWWRRRTGVSARPGGNAQTEEGTYRSRCC